LPAVTHLFFERAARKMVGYIVCSSPVHSNTTHRQKTPTVHLLGPAPDPVALRATITVSNGLR